MISWSRLPTSSGICISLTLESLVARATLCRCSNATLFLVLLGLVHARHLARESGKFPSARYESEGTVRSRRAQEGSLRTATKKSGSQG